MPVSSITGRSIAGILMRHIAVVGSFLIGQLVMESSALADEPAATPPRSESSGASDAPAPDVAMHESEVRRTQTTASPAVVNADGEARAEGAVRPPLGADDGLKIGVGVDATVIVPVGEFMDESGPIVGGTLRLGYDVSRQLQAYVRVGYEHGLSSTKTGAYLSMDTLGLERETVKVAIDVIPITFGGRYFLMRPTTGLYGSAELGLNILRAHRQSPRLGTDDDSTARIGANLGAGYVISRDLPINIGVQIAYLNLLGTDGDESAQIGMSAQLGYELRL